VAFGNVVTDQWDANSAGQLRSALTQSLVRDFQIEAGLALLRCNGRKGTDRYRFPSMRSIRFLTIRFGTRDLRYQNLLMRNLRYRIIVVNVPPRKRLTAAARRAQLLEVGRAAFARKGYEATSVEEIAARAKVSKPIVYEHFGGKEGLYAVVVDREMEQVVTVISEAISTGSPRERVEKASLAFLIYVEDNPEGFAVLAHDAPSRGTSDSLASLMSEVADRVGRVFTAAFKEAGYDPRTAPIYAHALVGMVTFVGQWWTESRKMSVEKAASHLAGLAWMGLRHLPKRPAPLKKGSLS